MNKRVTIIDYGMGNLLSVTRAFEYLGCQPIVTNSPKVIADSDRLVLPGVGAFPDGMKELHQRGLVEAIRESSKKGHRLLGICLGMQMMMDCSEEFGWTEGLGLIPGRVVKIPTVVGSGRSHKIPHIGWNQLQKPELSMDWAGSILEGIEPGTSVYFVHSFTAVPKTIQHRLADARYDECLISAAIRKENIYGCQFHPEKSGAAGLRILRNFLEMN